MEQQLYQLETDLGLRRLTAPLNLVEFNEMEEEIKKNGGAKGVKVWGKTILVDYEYYEYCHKQKIPFCIVSISLETWAEAVAWICKNQLLRKSLSEAMKKYLIGKRSLAERTIGLRQMQKLENHVDQQDCTVMKLAMHNVSRTHVRERIGTEYLLAYMTVRKYESYAQAIDILYAFSPEFVEAHLAGRLKVSFDKIDRLVVLPPEAVCSECQRMMQESSEARQGLVKGMRIMKGNKIEILPAISIKNMPTYDPDAEIVSLSLTVPSWTSSILRVRDVSNIAETSPEARCRLREALISLKSITDKMLYVLREDNDGRI